MTKSKFFRVAVEGATVDGRTIDRKWLEEMAATYNPQTYASRVNLEHIRGAVPLSANAPFGSYGDILSVKTDTVELDLGGQKVKKLALLAEIEALDPLIELTRKGQKLYTSIEVNPSFAETGKAYLMGIAVTDSPASLGTEMLEFSAKMGANSPLAGRKQQPGNFFSVATETQIELVDDTASTETNSLTDAVKKFLAQFTPASAQPAPAVEPEPKPQPTAATAGAGDMVALGALLGQIVGGVEKLGQSFTTQVNTLRGEMESLKGQINATPQPGQPVRPVATGAGDNFVKTDC